MITQPYFNNNLLMAILSPYVRGSSSYALENLTWANVVTGDCFSYAAGNFTCLIAGNYAIRLRFKGDINVPQNSFEISFSKGTTRLVSYRTNSTSLLEDSFTHVLYWDRINNVTVGSLPSAPSVGAFGSIGSDCEYIYSSQITINSGDVLKLESLLTRNPNTNTGTTVAFYEGELIIQKLS